MLCTREKLGEIDIFKSMYNEVSDMFVEELLFIEDGMQMGFRDITDRLTGDEGIPGKIANIDVTCLRKSCIEERFECIIVVIRASDN